MDESFSEMVGDPKRLLSFRGSRRRHHSSSGSELVASPEKQASIQRQASYKSQPSKDVDIGGQVLSLKKKQEEWDKDTPKVGWGCDILLQVACSYL